jgi:hypothetical protein
MGAGRFASPPFAIAHGLDVGHTDVEEGADPVGVGRRLQRHGRLVLGWAAADVDDDEAVGERHARGLAAAKVAGSDSAAVPF